MRSLWISSSIILLLTGCASSAERQFMQGCTEDMGAMSSGKKVCACIYEKLEDTYGEESLERMNEMGYLPESFGENAMKFTEQCMGISK
ncbi:hypothetical protein [Psychrobacter sp. I-STPA10]|uniref:hypothetical protein n=1 Tax=Psychrobacter sp. I-STPA10 TaxID=2585769 RepID=UPI001E454A4F|nr:hypothetical protein [Psychrobacter sp. I-STPA10]